MRFPKINKKAAAFEAYTWFIVISALILLTVSLIHLFIVRQHMPLEILGNAAENAYSALSQQEKNLTIIEESAKIAANKAALDLAKKGGISSPYGEYFAAPIITSNTDISKVYKEASSNFVDLFVPELQKELVKNGISYSFSQDSVSLLDDGQVYGSSLSTASATKSTVAKYPTGFWANLGDNVIPEIPVSTFTYLRYQPNFRYEFQDYSLADYKEIFGFVKSTIIPKVTECNSESDKAECVHDKIVEITDSSERYEVSELDQCIVKFNGRSLTMEPYIDSYKVKDSELVYYDFSYKLKSCLNSVNSEVLCSFAPRLPLEKGAKITLNKIIRNNKIKDELFVLYFDPEYSEYKQKYYERMTGFVAYTSKDFSTKLSYADLILNTDSSMLRNIDSVTILATLDTGKYTKYESSDKIYLYKKDSKISFVTKKEFEQLNKAGVKALYDKDLTDGMTFICITDKERNIGSKIATNYVLANPTYDLAIYTSSTPLPQNIKQQAEEEQIVVDDSIDDSLGGVLPEGYVLDKTVKATITAYNPIGPGLMQGDDPTAGTGVTSIGKDAFIYDGVAVDPKLIPYGSIVYIPGVGYKVADDTGGRMRQDGTLGIYHIDVRMEDYTDAIVFGKQEGVEIEIYKKA
jgi:3D (Asp-Asp-Asp) domain-containing protein